MSFTVLRKGEMLKFVQGDVAHLSCECMHKVAVFMFFLSLVHFPLHNYPSLMERHGANKLSAVIRTPSKAASPYGNWRKYVTLLPAIVSAHVPRDTCIVVSGGLGFHFAGGREKRLSPERSESY